LERRLTGENDGAMNDVLKLAHVARPVITDQGLQRSRRYRPNVAVAFTGDLAHEVLHEERDVLAPLPERRHVDGQYIETIEEVVAERPLAHRLAEIDVGGGEHAHVDRDRPHAAHPLHLALLEHAEQARLEIEAQGADLVEEDGTAVSQLELAELARVGAGEGAALVAEQLRFDQRVGNGRHVDGDEGLVTARAAPMDGPRHQFLAGAALARDEHRRRRLGDLRDQLIDAHHLGMAADQALEAIGALPSAGRQRRPQAEDLALERSLFERALDEEIEIVHVERLHEVVVGAQPHGGDGGAHVPDGGGQDHDDGRVEGFDAGQDLDARLPRHPLIEHDDVDLASPEDVERHGTVLGLDDVAGLLQDRAHGGAHALLVVHDENGAAAHHGGMLDQCRRHGWRGRSRTTYSLRPALPVPERWTHSG